MAAASYPTTPSSSSDVLPPAIFILAISVGLPITSIALISTLRYFPSIVLKDFCPPPFIPFHLRQRTTNRWRWRWRIWGGVGITTHIALVVLVLAHHALNSSVWITIANHGLLICIWAYHAMVPPIHIVATSTTLLLTLPLPIARGYALIHLAYKIAKEREPLLAFTSVSELSLWGLDMVTSCGIAAMVLNMNLGESQEKFISRSSTESFVDAGNSPEHAPLLHHNGDSPTRSYTNEQDSTLVDLESSPGSSETPIDTQQWKDLGYQGPSPESVTTIWNSITYNWLSDLFKLGATKSLEPSDCWGVPESMRCNRLNERFRLLSDPTLSKKIVQANMLDIVLIAIYTWLMIVAEYLGPYCLKRILDGVTIGTTDSRADAFLFAFVALISHIAKAQFESFHVWHARRAAIRIRSTLLAQIYEKALRRPAYNGTVNEKSPKKAYAKASQGSPHLGEDVKEEKPENKRAKKKSEKHAGADIGQVVQLMSLDTSKISSRILQAHVAFGSPIQVIVATVFLYRILGWAALAGVVPLVLAAVFTTCLSQRGAKLTRNMLKRRDERLRLTLELLTSIRYIKLSAWEHPWMQKTLASYQEEMGALMNTRLNTLLFGFIWQLAPLAMTLLSFVCFVLYEDGAVTVSIAFTVLSIITMLKGPLGSLSAQRLIYVQAAVSLERIEAFLAEKEVYAPDGTNSSSSVVLNAHRLVVESATVEWPVLDRPAMTLRESDLQIPFRLAADAEFPPEKFSLIIGDTGSGKSALLLALLGEMSCMSGTVHLVKQPHQMDDHGLHNTVAYAAQTPWLQNGTIRDAITFGAAYEQDRFEAVLDCCQLRADLELFERGDLTEIGDKAVTLSGGQKARVALARCVYSRAKHLLLDDPFASLDVGIVRSLVRDCFKGPLLRYRTVIIISHNADLLLSAGLVHTVFAIRDGVVTRDDSHELLIPIADVATVPSGIEAEHPRETLRTPNSLATIQPLAAETRRVGGVSSSVYWLFCKATSWQSLSGVALCLALQQGCVILTRYWLKWWGEAYGQDPSTPKTLETVRPLPSVNHFAYYLGGYAVIGLLTILFETSQQAVVYKGTVKAALYLHARMLEQVVGAKLRFYDVTPTGRIMNRFANDLEYVHNGLGNTLVKRNILVYFGTVISSMVVLAWMAPIMAPIVVIILFSYFQLFQLYVQTARAMRRMMANARSPLYSHFAELIEGLVTVRAFSAEKRFMLRMYNEVDDMQSKVLGWQRANAWLLLNFGYVGGFTIGMASLISLLSKMSAGSVGIVIVSAQAYVQALQIICRDWTSIEQSFTSLERIEEYLHIPPEPPAIEPNHRPSAAWPLSSRRRPILSVQSLRIRYAEDLPEVLHGVSFDLGARERLGIVGRSGSGKSTLTKAILRFCEPSAGRIIIDGIDITSIGVNDLRSRLTYIPQEAALFNGTIRNNLDPQGEHDDVVLQAALNSSFLNASAPESPPMTPGPSIPMGISRIPSEVGFTRPPSPLLHSVTVQWDEGPSTSHQPTKFMLDTLVAPYGSNFSQGQRQLISLARAIVRQSAIVLSDEATSSVDYRTDSLIQKSMTGNFRDSALIVVAHRLSTVMNFDRIIVMEAGCVIECDTPCKLLQDPQSALSEMVRQSGQEDELRAMAEDGEVRRAFASMMISS